MNNNNDPVDILIYWVDDKDETWKDSKIEAIEKFPPEPDSGALSNIRFESWDNLHYLFRAVEKNMPWYRNIVFVTCGHLPSFLRIDHPRLKIVKHDDYMPKEYLPTFNSSTIEMNVHRIKELAENFILFNDDMIPLRPIQEEYYFKNNRVCDEAVENIITTASFGPVSNMARYFQVNNMFIINKYFRKSDVQKENPEIWFCEDYGDRLDRTKSLTYWRDFPGFYDPHLPCALKKSIFKKIWGLEFDKLDLASRNRFRAHNDLTHYLVRYWQICEGKIFPRRTQGKVFFVDINNYREVSESIRKMEYQMISINESCSENEFDIIKNDINSALEDVFPEKSSYEK